MPVAVDMLDTAMPWSSLGLSEATIVVSDGEPNCPGCSECIDAITQANWQRKPVNTLYINSSGDAGSGGTPGALCMQQLAAANNGTYTYIVN